MPGTDRAQLANGRLLHLQQHHTRIDLLFGQFHVHRLVAGLLVQRVDCITRLLDIGERFAGAEERFDCALDLPRIEHGVAAHDVLVDVHRGRWRSVLREHWKWQRRQGQQ